MDRLVKIHTTKSVLKQRLDFSLENKIETMDRLAKVHGRKNCCNNG